MLILYIVVQILPKVTDIFETTQVLKPGNLMLAYETTGYFIEEESVCVAAESGDITYLVEEGTAVKKGHPVISIQGKTVSKDEQPRFSEYTERLKKYETLSSEYNAPISGVFCLYIDGYENYFTVDRMEKIKKETVEGLSYKTADLKRDSAIQGEPVYKIAGDDNWYILCWVDEKTAKSYEEGRQVTLELPDGSVEASIYKIKKEEEAYRVLFYLDVYYESFGKSRAEQMNIVVSDNAGLIVSNQCIIEKDGEQGVYVKDKNGDYSFVRIGVIATDGEDSVIEDATFLDSEGNQVYTVDVYDEVLKHPASALEADLKKESEED